MKTQSYTVVNVIPSSVIKGNVGGPNQTMPSGARSYQFVLKDSAGLVLTYSCSANSFSKSMKATMSRLNVDQFPDIVNGMPLRATINEGKIQLLDSDGPATTSFVNKKIDSINTSSETKLFSDTTDSIATIYDNPYTNSQYMGHTSGFIYGKCISVHDGDTITVETIDNKTYSIRMLGIFSEEVSVRQPDGSYKETTGATKEKAEKQRVFTDYLCYGKNVIVEKCSHAINQAGDVGVDTYGRTVGIIYVLEDTQDKFQSNQSCLSVNKTILANDMAKLYLYTDKNSKVTCPHVVEWYEYVRAGEAGLSKEVVEAMNNEGLVFSNASVFGDSSTNFNRIPAMDDRPDLRREDHVRIGDCEFFVPPSSINITNQRTTTTITALRSKGSTKTQSGHGDKMVELSIYFVGPDAINGVPITDKNNIGYKVPPGKTYYMDGLRSLIAQFMRTPFLPIENDYINIAHDIQAVTLVNLTVQTVEGLPDTLVANLTLLKFNWDAYLFDAVSYSDRFNWPMFRYYYQRNLLDSDSPRLKPITRPTGKDFNTIKFYIPNEDEIKESLDKWKSYNATDKPTVDTIRESFTDTTAGKRIHDLEVIQTANSLIENHKITGIWDEKLQGTEVYGKQDSIFILLKDEANIEDLKDSARIYMRGTIKHGDLAGIGTEESIDVTQPVEVYTSNFVKLYSKIFKRCSEAVEGYENAVNEAYKRKTKEYEDLYNASDRSGSGFKTYAVEGTESIIATNITIVYENIVTSLPMQGMDTPVHQYLGSQDIFAKVSMKATSQEAVANLMNAIDTSNRFAREYRDFIVSSIFDVENDMLALFGVKSCLIDNVSVTTTPNNPELFNIELVLVDFDKTQRTRQQFNSATGVAENANINNINSTLQGTNDMGDGGEYSRLMEQIRTFELYPDLELPRYKEVNDTLASLHIASKLKDAKEEMYVDPDFYIGIKQDFKSLLKEALKENMEITVEDIAYKGDGDQPLKAKISTPTEGSGGDLVMDESTQAIFESMGTAVDNFQTANGYAGANAYPETVDGYQPEDIAEDGLSSKISKSNADRYNIAKKYCKEQPTQAEVKKWFANGPYPLKACNNASLTTRDKFFTSNPSIQNINDIMVETWKTYVGDKTIQNKQCLAIVKAIANVYSGWNNITGLGLTLSPMIYSSGYVGIVPINYEEYFVSQKRVNSKLTLDEACRELAYSWPINIKFAMTKVKACMDSTVKSYTTNIAEITIAKFLYGDGVTKKVTIDDILNDSDIKNVMKKYQLYTKTPTETMITNNTRTKYRAITSVSDSLDKAATSVTVYTKEQARFQDLGKFSKLTTAQMNQFILSYRKGNSPFIGAGGYFIEASEASGLDPRYILAHAATETGWGTSKICQEKHNYFGIRAYDSSPMESATTFSSMRDGIVAGAKWIRHEFYDKYGQKTLQLMEYGVAGHLYATAQEDWINSISSIMAAFSNPKRVKAGANTAAVVDQAANPFSTPGNIFGKYMVDTINGSMNQNKNEILYDWMAPNSDSDNVDPTASYTSSCEDMLLYDARGRLVRAFPTFQFFFVDEGRWLTYNRLWDNLYGYNSVASLDVHKSRMSPADTLQVELNNSYNTISKNDSSSYKDDGIDFLQFIGIEKVTDDLIQERKKTLNQLYIKPGCRVHLKMGYGSDPTMLPIVFNGTITEIDVKDVTTITAQGDGVELTNKIEAEYGDTSGGTVTAGNEEPRNLILWLLDDRSFFDKWVTEDKFKMKTTPKGVVHFGNTKYHPWKQDEAEVGQNIYTVVLSDDQADRETVQGSWDWVGLLSPKNDEPNLKMYVYDKTAWDIITICRMVDPEYIAAVHPFELRSTLYVGKPYWKMAYGYTTNGAIDEKGNVSQYGVKELKKTFQQYRIYNSATDIVMNEIRASEDGVYTNVVAMYSTGEEDNPNKSILVSADTDIYPEKQKTTIVNSEIKGGKIPNAWGADRIANGIGVSALVDSMKLMYKGNMIVLGDPTAKPYDLMYVQDTYKRINGTSEIRECTLSMSRETGFITSIQPDACVSSIDKWKVNRATWLGAGLGVTVGTNLLLRAVDVHATRAIARAIATPALNTTKATLLKGSQLLMTDQATNIMNKSYSTVYNRVTQTVVDFKAKGLLKADSKMVEGVGNIFKKLGITATENFTDDIAKAAMSGAVTKVKGIISAGKEIPILAGIFAGAAGTTGAVALAAVVLPAVAEAAVWYIVTESLLELFQRRLQNRQAVTIIPLKLYGKEFTAGIYGHRGCVVGDTQGDVDKALSKLSWIFGESHSYTYEMGKDYDQEKETYNVTDQTGGE